MMNEVKLFPSQQMLQYVSRDATLFIQSFVKTSVFFFFCFFFFSETCEVAQLFSTVDGTELVIVQDGEYNVVVRDMSSGMCNQESFSLPKCVSAMLSQFAEKKEGRKKRGGGGVSQRLSKMWLEFQEAALVTT